MTHDAFGQLAAEYGARPVGPAEQGTWYRDAPGVDKVGNPLSWWKRF
jgi:hypothetical protein